VAVLSNSEALGNISSMFGLFVAVKNYIQKAQEAVWEKAALAAAAAAAKTPPTPADQAEFGNNPSPEGGAANNNSAYSPTQTNNGQSNTIVAINYKEGDNSIVVIPNTDGGTSIVGPDKSGKVQFFISNTGWTEGIAADDTEGKKSLAPILADLSLFADGYISASVFGDDIYIKGQVNFDAYSKNSDISLNAQVQVVFYIIDDNNGLTKEGIPIFTVTADKPYDVGSTEVRPGSWLGGSPAISKDINTDFMIPGISSIKHTVYLGTQINVSINSGDAILYPVTSKNYIPEILFSFPGYLL